MTVITAVISVETGENIKETGNTFLGVEQKVCSRLHDHILDQISLLGGRSILRVICNNKKSLGSYFVHWLQRRSCSDIFTGPKE